jgi:hypothetical protein
VKRAKIKVGEVYGVRCGGFDDSATVVPARVVALDVPVEWQKLGYPTLRDRFPDGGIEVEFIEPTRIGFRNRFLLAAKTNENGGKIEPSFVFHDKRPGCGGNVGRCFVGVWSELQAQARAEKRAEREQKWEQERRADAFAPALADFLAKLRKIGLHAEMHGDASGLHGDVDVRLYTNGEYGSKARPVGFDSFEVTVSMHVLDQFIEIALRHGEKITTTETAKGD